MSGVWSKVIVAGLLMAGGALTFWADARMASPSDAGTAVEAD
jgi:hypothetical protein